MSFTKVPLILSKGEEKWAYLHGAASAEAGQKNLGKRIREIREKKGADDLYSL